MKFNVYIAAADRRIVALMADKVPKKSRCLFLDRDDALFRELSSPAERELWLMNEGYVFLCPIEVPWQSPQQGLEFFSWLSTMFRTCLGATDPQGIVDPAMKVAVQAMLLAHGDPKLRVRGDLPDTGPLLLGSIKKPHFGDWLTA